MLLENLQIETSALPHIEEVKFEKLEPNYLWMRLLGRLIFFLILAGICIAIILNTPIAAWALFAPWVALFLVVILLEIKGFPIKGYALRQNDITYKTGLLWFHMTSVPFNRIQHCEVSQGPLGRIFGLSSVKVYTAGGSSSDLSIGGLKKEKAEKLRDYVIRLSADYE